MWIQHTGEATTALVPPADLFDADDPDKPDPDKREKEYFQGENKAVQVPERLGELLIERYDSIERYESED